MVTHFLKDAELNLQRLDSDFKRKADVV